MSETRILMVPSWQLAPSDRLSPRDTQIVCRAALQLWQTGRFDLLLLTGGVFLPPHIQTRPSAELMKDWFRSQDVEPSRIVTETRSLDTFENIAFSLTELRRRGIENPLITVCTQWLHALRIRHTFQRAHGVAMRVHAIRFHMSWRDLAWQWLCVAYHWYDPGGMGRLAKSARLRRSRAASRAP